MISETNGGVMLRSKVVGGKGTTMFLAFILRHALEKLLRELLLVRRTWTWPCRRQSYVA